MGEFFYGLEFYVASVFRLSASPVLRGWYWNTLKRCVSASVILFVLLLGLGSYVFSSGALGLQGWWAGLATLLWIFMMLYFSGTLTAALVTFFGSFLLDERAMLEAAMAPQILEHKGSGLKNLLKLDRRREQGLGFVNTLLTIVLAPLFLFPFLLPFLILIYAFLLGYEASVFGRRLCHDLGESSRTEKTPQSRSFWMGLGFFPSLFAFVPLLGWLSVPLLYYAGFIAERSQENGILRKRAK